MRLASHPLRFIYIHIYIERCCDTSFLKVDKFLLNNRRGVGCPIIPSILHAGALMCVQTLRPPFALQRPKGLVSAFISKATNERCVSKHTEWTRTGAFCWADEKSTHFRAYSSIGLANPVCNIFWMMRFIAGQIDGWWLSAFTSDGSTKQVLLIVHVKRACDNDFKIK